jgi:hypothetical protein
MAIKPLSLESNLASASDVSSATVVRIFNTAASNVVITVSDDAGAVATLTLAAGEIINLQKAASHTLTASASGSSVKVVKIAHAN